MTALLWRELAVIARTGPYWVAALMYVSVLAWFVLVWADGMPVVGWGSNWQQFSKLQWALMIVILPWIAVRCGSLRRSEVSRLAAFTATRPSRIIGARCVALTAALLVTAVSALPMILVMRQAGAVSLATAAARLIPSAGLASFVAILTTTCVLLVTSRLSAWVLATAVTIATALLVPSTAWGTAVWLLLAVAVAVPVLRVADARLTYLELETV
jgi:hypothetical protein